MTESELRAQLRARLAQKRIEMDASQVEHEANGGRSTWYSGKANGIAFALLALSDLERELTPDDDDQNRVIRC